MNEILADATNLEIFAAEMSLGGKQELNVLLSRSECVGNRHVERYMEMNSFAEGKNELLYDS